MWYTCYRNQITNSAKGGDDYDELIFIGCHICRLRYAERKDHIVLMHIRSRVCFLFVQAHDVLADLLLSCTRRGAFCFLKRFSWKALEYKSNGKSGKSKGGIYDENRYD